VADSPYPVLVLPGEPSFRCCTVEGPGRHQAHAGSRATFTVTVRDACGNLCDQLMPQQLEKLLPIQVRGRQSSEHLPPLQGRHAVVLLLWPGCGYAAHM
jgi:hypothetical protein